LHNLYFSSFFPLLKKYKIWKNILLLIFSKKSELLILSRIFLLVFFELICSNNSLIISELLSLLYWSILSRMKLYDAKKSFKGILFDNSIIPFVKLIFLL